MKNFPFLLQATVALLLSITIYWALVNYDHIQGASYANYIFLLIYTITFLSYLVVTKVGQLDKAYFMAAIMGSIVLRLIVFTAANFVMIYFNREEAVANVVLFFVLYLLFTIIETIALLKKVKT